MKNLILLILGLVSGVSFGQVASLDYHLKYNCETNQYDVSIVVLSGSAATIPQRAQFNSQISIVVPTGEAVEITDRYMPLNNNQMYTGSSPLIWTTNTPLIAPEVQEENDFYGITPTLSPASFYNDLEVGDIVKIFSFTAGESGQYDEDVRLFDNDEDPDSLQEGFESKDFSNGFTLGSSQQIYHGNQEESCITDVDDEFAQITSVYPNPFQNQITVEVPKGAENIYILGLDGKLYYQANIDTQELITINTRDFTSGVYFVKIEWKTGIMSSSKILKF